MRLFYSVVAILLSSSVYAQLGGTRTFAFLNLPNSARAEALGGSIVSMYDDDVALAYNNPSLLNEGAHNQLLVSFNNYFANIGYGYAGYARHWKNIGTFHAGIQYINYGDFRETNENGDILGTFTASDYCITLGYARSFFDSVLHVGANWKNIISQYHDYNSYGMAFDLGATYVSKNKLFTASLLLKNMGGQLKSYTPGNKEPLPFEIQLGISGSLKYVPVRLMCFVTNLQRPDLSYVDPANRFQIDPLTNDTIDTKLNVGLNILRHFVIAAEIYPFKEHLFLRIGYNFQRSGEMKTDIKRGAQGICYGIGIKINAFSFSYSRAEYHLAGSPNHISLNIDINKLMTIKSKRKSKQETLPETGS